MYKPEPAGAFGFVGGCMLAYFGGMTAEFGIMLTGIIVAALFGLLMIADIHANHRR